MVRSKRRSQTQTLVVFRREVNFIGKITAFLHTAFQVCLPTREGERVEAGKYRHEIYSNLGYLTQFAYLQCSRGELFFGRLQALPPLPLAPLANHHRMQAVLHSLAEMKGGGVRDKRGRVRSGLGSIAKIVGAVAASGSCGSLFCYGSRADAFTVQPELEYVTGLFLWPLFAAFIPDAATIS